MRIDALQHQAVFCGGKARGEFVVVDAGVQQPLRDVLDLVGDPDALAPERQPGGIGFGPILFRRQAAFAAIPGLIFVGQNPAVALGGLEVMHAMDDAVGAQVVEQVAEVVDLVFGQQSFRFRVRHRPVPGEAQQVGSSVGNVFAAAQRFEDGIGSVARLTNEPDRGVFDDGHWLTAPQATVQRQAQAGSSASQRL